MERKRHYRRLDQLRELLISHGVELLLESNPDDRDAVTFARVFARVERAGHPRVTKGSVLGPGRAWASQRQFQQDVEAAAALALGDIDQELSATLATATSVLEEVDLSTRAGRAQAAQQLCRRAGEAYFTQLTVSKTWRLWVGLWGRLAASSGVDDDGGLGTSLRQAQLGSLRRLVEQLYAPLADVIGFRGRPEYGTHEDALAMMAVAALGITDGLAIHERLFPEHFSPVPRPTGPGGAPELWHPFAIAFEALVNQYLEPAPTRSASGSARRASGSATAASGSATAASTARARPQARPAASKARVPANGRPAGTGAAASGAAKATSRSRGRSTAAAAKASAASADGTTERSTRARRASGGATAAGAATSRQASAEGTATGAAKDNRAPARGTATGAAKANRAPGRSTATGAAKANRAPGRSTATGAAKSKRSAPRA